MRLFFGSDFIGNQKIFGITVTATNCTYSGDTAIAIGGTAEVTFVASAGYKLPASVTVTGATSVWDRTSGVLALSNSTGYVTIEISAEANIYGVSGLYDSNPILTRTDEAIGMSYAINSSTGLVSSDFDTAFPWNEATVETVSGNKFLHFPEMWFRVGKDSSNRITDIAVSKQQHGSGSWYKVDSFYYGCYGASVDSNYKMCSVSGVARRNTTTIANMRTYAANNGEGYHQLDLYHKVVLMFLWWIEFASKNSQTVLQGKISGDVVNTGGTDDLTTPSGYNVTTNQMRWHYIEDFLGNLFEYCEGVTATGTSDSNYRVTADPSKFGSTSTSLNSLSYNYPSNASSENRCIYSFGWDDDNPFLCQPMEQGGTNYTVYCCDANAAANNVVAYIGTSTVGGASGFFGVSYFNRQTAAAADVRVGARLLYKPAV